MLVQRRQAISELLANTAAVARNLTGLVKDNEAELAPTLDRLNAVTAMLEKNRDNLAKALPGLKKFEITTSESVASGPYYSAYVPNLIPPQLLQPFFDYAFGFRAGDAEYASRTVPVAAQRHSGRLPMKHAPRLLLLAILVVVLVAGTGFVVRQTAFKPQTILANFSSATSLYPGDDVRIAGVKVGTIRSISPQPDSAVVTLDIDHDVRVPADAKAVIVAQNLVAARYVQLAPLYRSGEPRMTDGAVIPRERTAVPVEWDEVKTQLSKLATELGPDTTLSTSSMGRFIESTADAMDGNGAKLRQTFAQLSQLARILSDGSADVVATIENLQTFVTALRDSGDDIVLFQDRLSTFSTVLADSRSDLDAAMSELAIAVGEVQRFVAGTRDKTSRAGAAPRQRYPGIGGPSNGRRKHPSYRANSVRQCVQHPEPECAGRNRHIHPHQLLQPRPVSLRRDRRYRQRHGIGNLKAVRPISRPGAAVAQLQHPAAASLESVFDAVANPRQGDLHRSRTRARRVGRGTAAAS